MHKRPFTIYIDEVMRFKLQKYIRKELDQKKTNEKQAKGIQRVVNLEKSYMQCKQMIIMV